MGEMGAASDALAAKAQRKQAGTNWDWSIEIRMSARWAVRGPVRGGASREILQ